MTRVWTFLFAVAAVFSVCGCPQQKPTTSDVRAARQSDPTMRQIDNARRIADEESSRKDDPALN